jgi:YHS domain-containing protein
MLDSSFQPLARRALALFVLLPMLGACRATSASAAPEPGHAQCPVCKCEGDLACVDVKIEADTPHTTVDGKTVYFCSEDCCCTFEKDPRAYSR